MKGYDIKVRLDDFRPLTWRDMIIPENITFHQLHIIMQKLWDFYDYHLYEFSTKDHFQRFVDFTRMEPDGRYIPDFGEENSRETYISEVFDNTNKINYEYDFGDSWGFTIEIKKKVDYDETYPQIKRFKGDYNPVEDCGGTFGLGYLIDGKDEKDEFDEDFELNVFDLEEKRQELKDSCNFSNNQRKDVNDSEEYTGLELDINFNEVDPFTTRKIHVPTGLTFTQLHNIIQCLVGLDNYHGFHFIDLEKNIYITRRNSYDDEEIIDADTTVIDSYIMGVEGLVYEYDFGESIYLSVIFVKTVDYDKNYPTIVSYEGEYNYVDDCHGTYGFIELLELKKHPEDADDEELYLLNKIKPFDKDKIQKQLKQKCSYTQPRPKKKEEELIIPDYDYVIKEDRIPLCHETTDDEYYLNTNEIVERDYSYILDAMKKEDFEVENPDCNIFREILYEDKVVGFATYETVECVSDASLKCVYILPEFRKLGLFHNELQNMLTKCSVGIFEPTHRIVELLINYGYAEYLSENLVASAINFDIPYTSFSCNKINNTLDDEILYAVNLYDMNICATIYLDEISNPNRNIIYYSRMLADDIKHHDCRTKRLELDKKYFDDIKRVMLDNSDKFIEIIERLRQKLPENDFIKNLPPEDEKEFLLEVLGEKGKLSPFFEEMINTDMIDAKRAFEVQNQIIDEIEEGIVELDGLVTRLNFLSNEKRMNEMLGLIQTFNPHTTDICPYCGMDLDDSESYCNLCGFNLNYAGVIPRKKVPSRDEMIMEVIRDIITSDTYNSNYEKPPVLVYYIDGRHEEDAPESEFKKNIYDILRDLEDNPILDEAFDYRLADKDTSHIEEYLHENKLITDELTYESWQNISSKYKVPQLKDILRENGMKLSGNKGELIDRLWNSLPPNRLEEYLQEFYSDEGNQKLFYLTQKGYERIKEYDYITDYRINLKTLSFKEFDEHYQKADKDMTKGTMQLLEKHEENAIKTHNQNQYTNALEVRRKIMEKGEYPIKDRILNELKLFIMNLNPMETLSPYKNGNPQKLDAKNAQTIRKLNKELRIKPDLLEEVYNSMEHEKDYSLEKTQEILNKVLADENIKTIRKEIN